MREFLSCNIAPGQIFHINLDTIIEMEQFRNPMLLVKQLADQGAGRVSAMRSAIDIGLGKKGCVQTGA